MNPDSGVSDIQASINVDVLYVIALEEELRGLKPQLPVGTVSRKAGPFLIETFIDHSVDDHPIHIAFWVTWDMGPEKVFLTLQNVVRALNPSVVVNIGIAGMMSGDARIGDVIIAQDIDYYVYRGAVDDGVGLEQAIQFGGKHVPCDAKACEHAREIYLSDNGMWQNVVKKATELAIRYGFGDTAALVSEKLLHNPIRFHIGPITSGPLVSRAEQFKQLLLRHRGRNSLCIEMEAAAVAMVMNEHFPEIRFLIVKGVSDPGNSSKRLVDNVTQGKNRAWAIQNAFEAAREIIRHRKWKRTAEAHPRQLETSDKMGADIIRNITDWFLPQPYQVLAEERQEHPAERYAQLSRAISLAGSDGNRAPVSQIVRELSNIQRNSSLALHGRPGTGKTSLLSLTYINLLKEWESGVCKRFPVLIGIRPSVGFRTEQRVELNHHEQLTRIETILRQVAGLHAASPDLSFVFLLDSGEAEESFVTQVGEFVHKHAKTLPGSWVTSGRSLKPRFGTTVGKRVSLVPIRRNTAQLNVFCDHFLRLVRPNASTTLKDRLRTLLAQTGLEDVDLFDASIGLQLLEADRDDERKHDAFALDDYAKLRLRQLGVHENDLDECILNAARYAVAKEQNRADRNALNNLPHPIRALARAHPRIHDFLVARILIHDLAEYNGDQIPASLACVYPQRINRIAKELMCASDLDSRCVSNGITILKLENDKASYRTKAFIAYLLGRVKKDQLQDKVKEAVKLHLPEAHFLHEYAKASSVTELPAQDREALLYARTLFITLAYLGDEKANEEYVSLLVTSPVLDAINRGFHLEYFGDQKYEIDLPLQNTDRLEDCPLTYERLFARLSSSEPSPIFEIELQTFCSLALRRHAAQKLTPEFRDRVRTVLRMANIRNAVKNHDLLAFLDTAAWLLEEEHLCPAGVLNKFMMIKDQLRMGWVVRGIEACESVSDHVMGAYFMGLMFLPAHSNETGYDKGKILNMLAIHDLAEAITGDILPENKGDKERERELGIFRMLRNLSLVPGLEDLDEVTEAFIEFEAGMSTNARIARDIDRLEPLFQLYRYADRGTPVAREADMIKDLSEPMKSDMGHRIRAYIEAWRRHQTRINPNAA